ncbi:hypothetical protein JCM14469_07280 [Desulfatiferula olefinivorans]
MVHQTSLKSNRPHSRSDDSVSSFCELLSIDFCSTEQFVKSLPFSAQDTTAGIENELQTVVRGPADQVDLPRTIRASNYFKNILKRSVSGDNERRLPERLKHYLENNSGNIWENSWVRFRLSALSPYADLVLNRDLMSDKSRSDSPQRSDRDSFFIEEGGETQLRIPVSYLLKLSLADIIGTDPDAHGVIKVTGESLMHHFLSDNTSPELFSFYTVGHNRYAGIGDATAAEAMQRYLFTQVLTRYANLRFGLTESGQSVLTYFSATPPVRQKRLNDLVPDSFYRELFMNPCLSGWDRGEDKKEYMGLCHRVLSRSRLNAVAKLKEAGIITRNLVVLPNMSNISLANNGTHVSLGSKKLSDLLARSQMTADQEKYLGDLVIKITEHFLPLFVDTYSAAPYRLSFNDFHPEKILAFLPHELDFTHLRMIWRRWKKKASLRIMGKTVTPFGPEWLDRLVSRLFRLKGDAVPDFRLIDYFACLMSSDESPALDGKMDNEIRLKKDLADMGIFDTRMPLYLLYRLRKFKDMKFSGFEGRYYSLFHSFGLDLAHAVNLQMLITALCYQYILSGEVGHDDIPDDPFTESERRQVFFGTAIGIPTFYVKKDGKNRFLTRVLEHTTKTRKSRRYPDYLRIGNQDFRLALLSLIREDGSGLIRELGLDATLNDLENRLKHPKRLSVSAKLNEGITRRLTRIKNKTVSSPRDVPADEFNAAAEAYYRDELRAIHTKEALAHVKQSFESLDLWIMYREPSYLNVVESVLGAESPSAFLDRIHAGLLDETLGEKDLLAFARLLILQIHVDRKKQAFITTGSSQQPGERRKNQNRFTTLEKRTSQP